MSSWWGDSVSVYTPRMSRYEYMIIYIYMYIYIIYMFIFICIIFVYMIYAYSICEYMRRIYLQILLAGRCDKILQ